MTHDFVTQVRRGVERSLVQLQKRVAVIVAAAVLLVAALLFALIAMFLALEDIVGALGAAVILALGLAGLGFGLVKFGQPRKMPSGASPMVRQESELRKSKSLVPAVITAFAAGLALAKGHGVAARRAKRERERSLD